MLPSSVQVCFLFHSEKGGEGSLQRQTHFILGLRGRFISGFFYFLKVENISGGFLLFTNIVYKLEETRKKDI